LDLTKEWGSLRTDRQYSDNDSKLAPVSGMDNACYDWIVCVCKQYFRQLHW